MKEEKPFQTRLWMWICLLATVLLLVFNFDPVGDGLEKLFGKDVDRWATNILLISLIIYAFAKKK